MTSTKTSGLLSLISLAALWLIHIYRPHLVIGEQRVPHKYLVVAAGGTFVFAYIAFAMLQSRGEILKLMAWGILLFVCIFALLPVWNDIAAQWYH